MPGPRKTKPTLLNKVLKFIAQDYHGSTSKKIVDHIKKTIRRSPRLNSNKKKVVLEIHKALKYGVENGLLEQRAERYKIGSQTSPREKSDKTALYNKRYSGATKGNRSRQAKSTTTESRSTTVSVSGSSSAISHSGYSTATTATSGSSSSRTHNRETKDRRSRRRRKSRSRRRRRRRRYSNANRNADAEPPLAPMPEPEPTPEAKPIEEDGRLSRSSSLCRQKRMKRCDEESENTVPTCKAIPNKVDRRRSSHRQSRAKLCDEESLVRFDQPNEEDGRLSRSSSHCRQKRMKCCDDSENTVPTCKAIPNEVDMRSSRRQSRAKLCDEEVLDLDNQRERKSVHCDNKECLCNLQRRDDCQSEGSADDCIN